MQYSKPPLIFEQQAELLLGDILRRYPEIQIKNMGFPDNWEDCTLWKNVG